MGFGLGSRGVDSFVDADDSNATDFCSSRFALERWHFSHRRQSRCQDVLNDRRLSWRIESHDGDSEATRFLCAGSCHKLPAQCQLFEGGGVTLEQSCDNESLLFVAKSGGECGDQSRGLFSQYLVNLFTVWQLPKMSRGGLCR